jgi:hypothetical protein
MILCYYWYYIAILLMPDIIIIINILLILFAFTFIIYDIFIISPLITPTLFHYAITLLLFSPLMMILPLRHFAIDCPLLPLLFSPLLIFHYFLIHLFAISPLIFSLIIDIISIISLRHYFDCHCRWLFIIADDYYYFHWHYYIDLRHYWCHITPLLLIIDYYIIHYIIIFDIITPLFRYWYWYFDSWLLIFSIITPLRHYYWYWCLAFAIFIITPLLIIDITPLDDIDTLLLSLIHYITPLLRHITLLISHWYWYYWYWYWYIIITPYIIAIIIILTLLIIIIDDIIDIIIDYIIIIDIIIDITLIIDYWYYCHMLLAIIAIEYISHY